jgi:hypothetical protein
MQALPKALTLSQAWQCPAAANLVMADPFQPFPNASVRLAVVVGIRRRRFAVFGYCHQHMMIRACARAGPCGRLGKPHRTKIYPPVGRTADEGHDFVDLGIATWEPDVFAFLDEHVRR